MSLTEDITRQRTFNVRFAGRIDELGRERFADIMSNILCEGASHTRVDLTDVSFIDSPGVSALARWYRMFAERNCRVTFVSANPAVRRAFALAGSAAMTSDSTDKEPSKQDPRRPIADCSAISSSWERCSLSVRGRLDSCKAIRDKVSQIIAEMPFSSEERGDIKMAVGEAISNAVKHGCKYDEAATVEMRCLATRDRLVVEISDHGQGFDPDSYTAPSIANELPESGMGINFMRKCMDEVSYRFSQGTTIKLVKLVCA